MRYLFSWIIVYIYTFIIFLLSVIPSGDISKTVSFNDKIVHFLIYFLLSFIVLNTTNFRNKKHPYIFSFSYAFGLGLIIEVIQLFLPYRSFEWGDLFSNTLGVISGSLINISAMFKNKKHRKQDCKNLSSVTDSLFIKGLVCIVTFSIILLSFLAVFAYPKVRVINKKNDFFRDLEERIKQEQKYLNGDFSFVIKDFSFPYVSLRSQQDIKIPAASLIKVPILAVAMQSAKEGKINLNDSVIIKRKDIAGGSGILKGFKPPLNMTFKEVLEVMITQSDNTATNKVIELLGFDYINNGFKRLGLTKTSLMRKMMDFSKRKNGVENYTSTGDIALILEKAYYKQLIDKDISEYILSLLKHQKINDRLPRYLPETVTVAHKTGLERNVVHDAGIIFTSSGDYLICVMTKGVNSYQKAKEFIANISKFTYEMYQESGS